MQKKPKIVYGAFEKVQMKTGSLCEEMKIYFDKIEHIEKHEITEVGKIVRLYCHPESQYIYFSCFGPNEMYHPDIGFDIALRPIMQKIEFWEPYILEYQKNEWKNPKENKMDLFHKFWQDRYKFQKKWETQIPIKRFQDAKIGIIRASPTEDLEILIGMFLWNEKENRYEAEILFNMDPVGILTSQSMAHRRYNALFGSEEFCNSDLGPTDNLERLLSKIDDNKYSIQGFIHSNYKTGGMGTSFMQYWVRLEDSRFK